MSDFKKVDIGINDNNELVVDVEGVYREKLSSFVGGSISPSSLPRAIFDNSAAYNGPGPAQHPLNWGTLNFGDESFLDLSDPTSPLVIEDGVYAVTASVSLGEIVEDPCQISIDVNLDADADDLSANGFVYVPAGQGSYITASGIYFIPAGGAIVVYGRHTDSIDHTLGLLVAVQRLI